MLLALGGILLLLLLLWLFTGNRNPDQDKLTGSETAQGKAGEEPEKLCSSKATYDRIKRELFRQAAVVRGSDQAAFDRLAAYATLRMENPVLESHDEDSGAAQCSGSLSLDLPPGVAVVGGRRTLTADVDYTVQPAADGSGNVVLLRKAEAVITPLATLARTAPSAAPPAQLPGQAEAPDPLAPVASGNEPAGQPAVAPPPSEPAAPTVADQPVRQTARPSYNCANARTRGEVAVCSDSGLASLDRQMAAQFGRAISSAGPSERALLQRTRGRFLSYRDSCRSDACIADAYRGRMREISDIMSGRWQPR